MYKKATVCLLAFLILLLSSCNISVNKSSSQTATSAQTDITTDPVNKTIWLTFSKKDFPKERAAIKQYFSNDSEIEKEVQGNDYVEDPIYIATYDLNNDGNQELIVNMTGILWGGMAGGRLFVMSYDGNRVTDVYDVANFRLDYEKLDRPGNNQIGIIRRSNGNYDFMVLDSLWRFNMNWTKQ